MVTLNYGIQMKWNRLRRWRWPILAVCAASALGVLWRSYPNVRDFCEHLSMLQVQRECVNFCLDAHVWIYSEKAADVTELSLDPMYEKVGGPGGSPVSIYRKPPSFWDKYRH